MDSLGGEAGLKYLFHFLALFLLASCASKPSSPVSDNRIAEDFRAPPSASLIVLLPVQVEAVELKPGAVTVMNMLHRRLTAMGYKVVALDPESHERIWSDEVGAVGGIYDKYSGEVRYRELILALGRTAQRISADTRAALVVRPQLVLRRAEISGMSAVWDGQQRRVPVAGTGGDTITHSGSTVGVSVGLDIFLPSGELVMHTYGGALLPYRVNVQSGKNEVRPDVFANENDVADGVGLALKPLLNM